MQHELSSDQKQSIVEIWNNDDFSWLFDIGIAIYSEIFRLAPNVKCLFGYVMQCEEENKNFTESKLFRAQALKFVQIIGLAVSGLSQTNFEDNFDDVLFELGGRHRSLMERGFKSEYWSVFENAVYNVMSKEYEVRGFTDRHDKVQLDQALNGWKILSNYIIEGMKKGFSQDEEIKDNHLAKSRTCALF